MLEETIADLKQNIYIAKARSKTVFTKARRHLLVLRQEQKLDEYEQLEMLMEELLEVTAG